MKRFTIQKHNSKSTTGLNVIVKVKKFLEKKEKIIKIKTQNQKNVFITLGRQDSLNRQL